MSAMWLNWPQRLQFVHRDGEYFFILCNLICCLCILGCLSGSQCCPKCFTGFCYACGTENCKQFGKSCPHHLNELGRNDHRFRGSDKQCVAALSSIRTMELLHKAIDKMGEPMYRRLLSKYESIRNCGFNTLETTVALPPRKKTRKKRVHFAKKVSVAVLPAPPPCHKQQKQQSKPATAVLVTKKKASKPRHKVKQQTTKVSNIVAPINSQPIRERPAVTWAVIEERQAVVAMHAREALVRSMRWVRKQCNTAGQGR